MSDLFLVGATGLVGSALAASHEAPLVLLGRREAQGIPSRHEQIVAPPEDWSAILAGRQPATLISCLGTTLAAAGSRAAFSAVDLDLVVEVARAARGAGTRHMICVSSVGASAASSNFYLRTKGRAEEALTALAFERLDIIRPGLLRGARSSAPRPRESIALMAAPLVDAMLHGPLRRYRSIEAETVARAISRLASRGGEGTHFYENDAIRMLAD